MVYLDRIYTKSGDNGETSLGNGARVSKLHPRIIAYGGVDELNSSLGLCTSQSTIWGDKAISKSCLKRLRTIQNDLFDVGADLCVPEAPTIAGQRPSLRVTVAQVEQLEEWIDIVNDSLPPLRSFILPGGTPSAAHLHLARAICRRVELDVLKLTELETINPQVPIYLNRLSDLLFVFARAANANGQGDVLWVPGGTENRQE